MAPCTTNRTPRREAISEGVNSGGTFRTADVGSTSTPDRLPRSDTRASAKPRHRPWSVSSPPPTATPERTSGEGGLIGHRSIFPDVLLRTELRPESESGISVDHPNRADESIPFSNYRLKKPRSVGVVTKRGAKLPHNVVHVFFGIDKQNGAPQPLRDVVAVSPLCSRRSSKED